MKRVYRLPMTEARPTIPGGHHQAFRLSLLVSKIMGFVGSIRCMIRSRKMNVCAIAAATWAPTKESKVHSMVPCHFPIELARSEPFEVSIGKGTAKNREIDQPCSDAKSQPVIVVISTSA
jgi:hypothetical protein